MRPLDLDTLVIVISAISLLFGILIWIFNKNYPTIKGPFQWSMGSFSAVVSSLLFILFPLVGAYFSYVGSGVFSILTIGFYWTGIRAFKELRVNYYIVGGLVLLQLFLGTLFYFIFSMPNARMVSYSAITILGYCFIINELIKPIAKPYLLAFRICLFIFIVSALAALFRIYVILTTLPGDAHIATSANQLVYFFINITQTLLLFTLVLLVSVKASERIKVKVEAQRKFFSIIAHDLNGPVGMINAMLNLANNDDELPVYQKNMIFKEAENLSGSTYHLLQNLLFWSRNQLEDLNPNFQEFDLNKVILENAELLRQIAKTKEISIEYEPNSDLTCMGDVRMIDTVIRNLISNSIKFTHLGGKIAIVSENSGTNVLVKIVDDGIGMSEETQKNLFQFEVSSSQAGTGGEKGTGLGLMLCKEFVEGNHGSLTIQSKENMGTEVIIKLQRA